MQMEGKIAAIGESDLIFPLKAVGVDIFPTGSEEEANSFVRRLAREGYSIIMVTENLAPSMQDTMREFQDEPMPSIVPIPSTTGSEGFAFTRLRDAIKRAVGTDILADKK